MAYKISVIRLVHFLVKLYAFQHFMTTYFLLCTWPIHVLRFHSKPFQSRLSQLCALYIIYIVLYDLYTLYMDLYQWMICSKLLSKFLLEAPLNQI